MPQHCCTIYACYISRKKDVKLNIAMDSPHVNYINGSSQDDLHQWFPTFSNLQNSSAGGRGAVFMHAQELRQSVHGWVGHLCMAGWGGCASVGMCVCICACVRAYMEGACRDGWQIFLRSPVLPRPRPGTGPLPRG